jgi:two-component system phosphate regulon sensor histidine kinase PhoR
MRLQFLFGVWLLGTIAATALVFVFGETHVIRMVAVVVGIASAILACTCWISWSRIAHLLRKLEDYAASLPGDDIQLPNNPPSEIAMLSSALRRASEHIRSVIEQSKLEVARREAVLAGMAEGVLAVNENLQVTFCNRAFAEAFGTRWPLPESRPLYAVVREPALHEVLSTVLSSSSESKCRLHLPAAGGRWFEVSALPLGAPPHVGAIVVLHDITETQRQEQVRKEFVANVSHELRTPLASIRGYAETLLDGGLEDREHNRKFVEVIQSHAIRLNNIASDLLILSELDARAMTQLAPVSVQGVIDAAIHAVEIPAAMQEILVETSICDGVMVLGDRKKLEQVMVNLLENSIKFNRPRGRVRVECVQQTEMVEVSVVDTGIGIPSEDLKRIFERFYRVDRGRSREAGGTGLGLSIVKEAIEQMGGVVFAESQLGQGSRFSIRLPAASA